MKPLDSENRRIALTAIDRTLLVEAGAGSGKTALLAGRVTYLLASGVSPEHIVAVTFTEMAASELRERIERYVLELESGSVPKGLDTAFPEGPDANQRAALVACKGDLDQLICTTIHGFCQRMLLPYPVEADIDPGARILDEKTADMLFEQAFAHWVNDTLSGEDPEANIVTYLSATVPTSAFSMFRDLAWKMRGAAARAPEQVSFDQKAVTAFQEAADRVLAHCNGLSCSPEGHDAVMNALQELCSNVQDAIAKPVHVAVVDICGLMADASLAKANGEFRAYRWKGKWQKAAATDKEGAAINEEVTALYDNCAQAWVHLRSTAAAAGLSLLADAMRPLIDHYAVMKKEGAYLDFDDLIACTKVMLREHPEVRAALSAKHQHILVDEFQDTDPDQLEIFQRLCFEEVDGQQRPRDGALFLVGDPKQAIYRFRGADVKTYLKAREDLLDHDPSCVVDITTNFRSSQSILDYVNQTFAEPLGLENQPGFKPLDAFRKDVWDRPAVSTLPVGDGGSAPQTRDLEADRVADACAAMIGSLEIPDDKGTRLCKPGDIALLAPTGTELWRYETALEERGIPVATQAGKGLFQRQEFQDLLAMTRAIADPRDTLAFGSFLRGPLIGFTDEELLDANFSLPRDKNGEKSSLSLTTDPQDIANERLREIVALLRSLNKRSSSTSPHRLLCEAVSMFGVKATIKLRHKRSPERALANIDKFLNMSLPYDGRGLRQFAIDMRVQWEESERQVEGRPDSEDDAVSLITMHSSKGLEWPVVFTINTHTEIKKTSGFFVDPDNGCLRASFLGRQPSGYSVAQANADGEEYCEQVRLWYVATTRARDLLVLPRYEKMSAKCWSSVVPLGLDDIQAADLSEFDIGFVREQSDEVNCQDRTTFRKEGDLARGKMKDIIWKRPSRSEYSHFMDEEMTLEDLAVSVPDLGAEDAAVGGRFRGDILHKLMEEILFSETDRTPAAIEHRSAVLVREYASRMREDVRLDPKEIAQTALRTLTIPAIAELLPRLQPEVTVFSASPDGDVAVAGVADAVEGTATGAVRTVVDWKSDLVQTPQSIKKYSHQVRDYMKLLNAERGLLVYMTSGAVVEVKP